MRIRTIQWKKICLIPHFYSFEILLSILIGLLPIIARAQTTVEYIHTDALGSPVATSNSSGIVIDRIAYEPYGSPISRTASDQPGFTGHVEDSLTGLTYMQQRYYDPIIGRFLSVDPVKPHENPTGAFNRYWYASNNPYRYTDPDGREVTFFAGKNVTQNDLIKFKISLAMSATGRSELYQLEQSEKKYSINYSDGAQNWFDRSNLTIHINTKSYTWFKSSKQPQSPLLVGIHEISHAAEYDRVGPDEFEQALTPPYALERDSSGELVYVPGVSKEEARATEVEKKAASELNLPSRENYRDICRKGDEGC